MKNIVIIYHKNCMDGTASAWVAWKKYGDTAEYFAADDRKVLPEYVTAHSSMAELEVYVFDFCYPKEILLDLEKKCKKLVVLDHHVTQKDDIESVQNHVYGIEKSGAMLAWEYFNPGVTAPIAIQYVSDSDTWEHKMPDYEIVDAYIYKTDANFAFADFDKLVKQLEDPKSFEDIKVIGRTLRDVRVASVNKYIEKAEEIEFAGHRVWAVNGPSELKSELGHRLAEKSGTFGIVYCYEGGKWRFSMRSLPDFDVSVIAQKFGGGGHKNAAAIHIASESPAISILKNLK